MLNEPQIGKIIGKMNVLAKVLEPHIFDSKDEIDFKAYKTEESLYSCPDSSLFSEIKRGDSWYGKNSYLWLSTTYTVPDFLDGKDIFIKPHIGGYEGLLFVNGHANGTFATKIVYTEHGNHYCSMIKSNVKAGEKIRITIEYYGGHDNPGCNPLSDDSIKNYNFLYNGAEICTKNHEISDFYFDLVTVTELAETLPHDSFMRGKAVNALYNVHKRVYYMENDATEYEFMDGIRKASPYLKEVLSIKSSEEEPQVGLIGHSHMDTAWLWHVGETKKKVARTYSNALNLMDQYPEYMFFQSSALHSDFIRENYPELFERIKEKVKEGRYEPNGGVWVECDCNITSGESMIRQFLWGQRFTRKYFGYTSDCFWLPDTFGYSAAIPQIMAGCDVKYFLTTKIDWNDTNKFPYDTFYWEGIDGTKVFTHFNRTHIFPDAKNIYDITRNGIKQKSVSNKRLCSYGFGDGGGGPQFEMIELARRVKDLAEIGKSKHETVSEFMSNLEKTALNPNVYSGELYLELHRGTLTNQHTIKRNNRKSELILRNLEMLTVNEAVKNNIPSSEENISKYYRVLLQNQFHDILPGTAINRAHEESRKETWKLISDASKDIENIVSSDDENLITLTNTLSFDRTDPIFIKNTDSDTVLDADCLQQRYKDLDGNSVLIVTGLKIPALSSVTIKLKKQKIEDNCKISFNDDIIETEFLKAEFEPNGTISSLVDKRASREVRGTGYPINTFIMAEDMPYAWDNWDIDADLQDKFKDVSNLISREVVSSGEAALIIRSEYKISEKSTVKQDMIFFNDIPIIYFDTAIDWQDNHRFLKTTFDVNVRSNFAKNEIQFGYLERPTTRNNSLEQAKFEVVNHKYTDLSETRYGVSVLNDCKYGISVEGGNIRLSLHKGGNHPDIAGDHDGTIHRCLYAYSLHNCGFSSDAVVKPAYEINVPVIASKGRYSLSRLAYADKPNIIIETIKPCEDKGKSYIVRMYECEGTRTNTKLSFPSDNVEITNMLEEHISSLKNKNVTFRPFEIKTFKVNY